MERRAQVSPALRPEPASISDECHPPSRELQLESPAVFAGVVGKVGGRVLVPRKSGWEAQEIQMEKTCAERGC